MKSLKFLKSMMALFVFIIGIVCSNNSKVLAHDFTLCSGFSYTDISPGLQKFIDGKSFKMKSSTGKVNDWVRFEDLRYLTVQHWGYDDKVHTGELIVHELVAKEVLEIFKELLDNKFSIYQIRLIEHYDVDDEKSMSNNNSHCLRTTDGSFGFSRPWHALGMAIDINPLVNPCYHPDTKQVEPSGGDKYLNRSLSEKGMIKTGDVCHKAFTSRGWEWGDFWTDPLDLYHFQKYHWQTVFPRKYK